MSSKTHDEWMSWIDRLLARWPDKNRYRVFYDELDRLIPDWQQRLRSQCFISWGLYNDTPDGGFMLGRLHSLWNDPAFSAAAFAALLRLFKAPTKNPGSRATLLRRFLGWRPETTTKATPRHASVLANRYELLEPLGRGGNGEVHLCWSRETCTVYALKLIRREWACDPHARETFRNEVEVWIRLGDHPNIAKAYFLDDVEQHLAVTMELVEGDDHSGPSLADQLEIAQPALQQVVTWFTHIADGLEHAYSHGIKAHRDIKPGNILITRDGVAKITDFGLAISHQTDAEGIGIAGTPCYMAPEQFLEGNVCDQRSDIYSLGVALYQVLSGGRLPFASKAADPRLNVMEVRSLHANATPKKLDTIFWPVISCAMAKDSSARFRSIRDFRSSLAEIAGRNGFFVPDKPTAKNEIWTLRDQGNTLMRLGKYEDAIKSFDAFLAIIPDESATLNRACCLENLGRFEEALIVYSKFAKRGDVIALNNGANCLKKLGDHASAEAYARRALAIAPGDSSIWTTLGNICYSQNKWHEAIQAFTKAHTLAQEDPTPLFNISLAALNVPDNATAIYALRAFLSLAASDDNRRIWADKALSKLTISDSDQPEAL